MAASTEPKLSVLSYLILVRLLATGEKGDPITRIEKDLRPLLVCRWDISGLENRIGEALGELDSSGLIANVRGKRKGAVLRVASTPTGRQRALHFLGVGQLRPKSTWSILRKIYLPSRALDMPVASEALFKAFSRDSAFRAVLLKQQYGLRTSELPSLEQAIDALAWQLIGFYGETRKFSVKNVKTLVINRALDNGRTTDLKKATARLLAKRSGAQRDDPGELRDAVVRGWLDQVDQDVSVAAFSSAAATDGFDLQWFAERVKVAARGCHTGRFGDNKVFVAYVWRSLQSDPAFQGMDLPAFKNRLAEANNARHLDLGRADLVQAMDPDDVRQSEIRYLNTTFHFVRI
jgi:hypothetical protein